MTDVAADLPTATGADPREALGERLLTDAVGAMETLSTHLGLALGLYEALADGQPATAGDLAARSGVAPRYTLEWLEQQASAGLLEPGPPTVARQDRTFRLPPAHAEVLLDTTSPYHAGSLAHMIAGCARVLPDLRDAYRTGAGVPYHAYGQEIRHGIGGLNRPQFLHELAGTWLPALPDIDARLRAAPPAAVLDVGCGTGASTVVLAQAYPRCGVVGIDLDAASVADARAAAAAAGVADRVSIVQGDAADLPDTGRFDLACVFEALHDMGDPVGALAAIRAALRPGGAVLVVDERVGDDLTVGDPLERLQYGFSVLHCLPATLAEDPVEANGTVLRPATLRRWAQQAGYRDVTVLPVDNPFWLLYRLDP